MQTERVTFLTTPDHKAALDAFAASNGQSVGHVLREASSQYIGQPTPEEEAELVVLVQQVNEAIPKMRASLDNMIATLDRTHRKVEAILAGDRARP
jgi:hypothetical protein